MLQIIFGCIIGNIITLAIIAAVIFYFYKKYKPAIIAKKDELEDKVIEITDAVEDISEKVDPFVLAIEKIAEKLEKLPFNNQ